jgi:tRNA(fMet)-specific endonuclease VapC
VTLFVLDTDHLSLYQRGAEPLVTSLLRHPPGELAITVVTVEEQLRGRLAQIKKATTAARLTRAYHWLHETFDQLSLLPVLDFDGAAATVYDSLLARKLRVGTQDLRIAAVVLSRGGVLLTRNAQDFGQVAGLRLDDWTR